MRVRRCAIVVVEPRERLARDLARVAGGGSGLRPRLELVAYAPHRAIVPAAMQGSAAGAARFFERRFSLMIRALGSPKGATGAQ